MSTPFLASAPGPSARAAPGAASPDSNHVLRFESLFDPDRSYSFPCDAQGQVSLNRLSERARQNYLFARACVGREFALPCVDAALH